MHDAYESCPILKLNNSIDSLAAYDDNLLVGTKHGHLVLYSITLNPNNHPKYNVQLIRYHKNFGKKPIQQLDVVPQYNILVSLSDNIISIYDMSSVNLPLISAIQKTRGATLFTLNIETHVSLTGGTSVTVFMCVVVKCKLQFFFWKNNLFLELRDDITVNSMPKALAWYDDTICIGFKGDYSLLQVKSGEQTELFPSGKNLEPIVIKVANSTFCLIRDYQSVFINTRGELLFKHAVKWSEIPIALAYDEPYIIAILNEQLEVRTVDPFSLVQKIPLSKAHLIRQCHNGLIYIAANFDIYCLHSVSIAKQVKILLDEKQFQLALKLSNISDESDEEKEKKIYQIQTLYAYDLFNNKQYTESMREFIKLRTDPYDVIRLYPNLLAQDDSSITSSPSSQKNQNRDNEKSLLALITYLTEVRLELMKDVKSENGVQILTDEQEQLLQIIDTTLVKCYLYMNDALIAPLLRLNHCRVAETEKILKKHKKYSELIILYQTKELHNCALELLEKQSDQMDSSLRGHDRTIQYLQHLGEKHIETILQFATWVLEKHPEDGLKIFTEDIPEVEQLPRPKVLNYLLKQKRSLVIPYLEHVIHAWNDTNPMIHNALIHRYREEVQKLKNSDVSADHIAAQSIRTKLLEFLEKSEWYTPETVLVHFPYDDLYEEKAIILGRTHHHESVLTIYVIVLQDFDKALKYCDNVYKTVTDKSHRESVYVSLLRLLIDPPESWLGSLTPAVMPKPDVEKAFFLLENYSDRIPLGKALQVLPDTVLLSRINRYLISSLGQLVNHRRKTQVLRGLLFAEYLQVQERRISCESDNVLLTELNICPVCKKRFGNQSAFVRHPNGTVVHYSCQDTKEL